MLTFLGICFLVSLTLVVLLFVNLQKTNKKLREAEKSDLISKISQALDTESGAQFYKTLIKLLAETLEVDFAFVGRYSEERNRIKAFSVYGHGDYIPEFTYDLEHTPCETAIEKSVCLYPEGVCEAYPDDEMLVEMNIDAYVGTRLEDSHGHPIGILVVLSHKPLEKPELVGHILRIFANRVAFEIEREESSQQLSYQANHDSLTGLINRYEFESRLKQKVLSSKRYKQNHALCFIDLDQFKVVNDTAGHIAGDALLQQISLLLSGHIRETDTLARIGGDEFAVLMENTALEQAVEKAKDLISLIEEFIFTWESRIYKIGASVGISFINETTTSDIEVLKQADIACYAAKDLGRNRVHVFQEEDQKTSERAIEMQWSPRIIQALDSDGFELLVQEIKPADSEKQHVNYEVLIRMKGEEGQYIAPGAFLPSAERYGLIGKIDYWVVDHVFRWLIKNNDKINPKSYFAINISGHSLANEDVLSHIVSWFAADLLPTSRIRFEITETMAISNLIQANRFIDTVRQYGCGISLDDFGSGLSSFGYLKNLKADTLKIDGLFVKNILSNPVDEALVESINHIGHLLGMETVAEFVENENIANKLKKIGVDYLQGYGISKPKPIESIIG